MLFTIIPGPSARERISSRLLQLHAPRPRLRGTATSTQEVYPRDKNSKSFYAALQYTSWKYNPHGIHARRDAKSEADTSGSTCENRELYTSTVSSFRHVRIFRHSIFVTDKQPHRLEPKSLAYLSLTDSFIALAQPLPSSTMNKMKSMQLVNACF